MNQTLPTQLAEIDEGIYDLPSTLQGVKKPSRIALKMYALRLKVSGSFQAVFIRYTFIYSPF